ncbi:MAG: flippase-like domain-containing protein [Nitrososphaeria archaeon]
MGDSSYSNTSKIWKIDKLKPLLLLIIGVLALTVFILFSDFESMINYISLADKVQYSIAFLSMILGVIAYAISWIFLLKSAKVKLGILKAIESTWISVFFNIMVPTASVSGEIARILYVVKETNDNHGTVAATVFLHRIITFLPFIFGSIFGFLYLGLFYNLPSYLSSLIVTISSLLIFALSVLLLFIVKPNISMRIGIKIASLLDRFIPKRWKKGSSIIELTGKAFSEFEKSMNVLKHGKTLISLSIIFAFLYWVFDVLVAYFVFSSLNFHVSFILIIAVYTIGISIQIIPIGIPGMVGFVETIMSGLYVISGIPLGLSVAATVMIRLVMMWFEALIGGLVFWSYSRRH